jgi:hypothetical protein
LLREYSPTLLKLSALSSPQAIPEFRTGWWESDCRNKAERNLIMPEKSALAEPKSRHARIQRGFSAGIACGASALPAPCRNASGGYRGD